MGRTVFPCQKYVIVVRELHRAVSFSELLPSNMSFFCRLRGSYYTFMRARRT